MIVSSLIIIPGVQLVSTAFTFNVPFIPCAKKVLVVYRNHPVHMSFPLYIGP